MTNHIGPISNGRTLLSEYEGDGRGSIISAGDDGGSSSFSYSNTTFTFSIFFSCSASKNAGRADDYGLSSTSSTTSTITTSSIVVHHF